MQPTHSSSLIPYSSSPPPGYKGTILTYDLTTGRAEARQPDAALYHAWIGGSSLAAWLAWEGWGLGIGQVDPFSPANPIMVMAGPLTDSRLPGLPRFTVSARSPLTGLWSESNCGGYFGAECKFAGYDGLIITGAAPAPSYLCITIAPPWSGKCSSGRTAFRR